MAKSIITAVRRLHTLTGSLFHTAKELAHRANGVTGQVRITYDFLAMKAHISRSTALRHIKKLLDMGIITITKTWLPGCLHCAPNIYTFQIDWERPKPKTPRTSYGGSLPQKFPKAEDLKKDANIFETNEYAAHQAKWGSMQGRDEVIGWLTPGSLAWQAAQENHGM